MQWVIATLPLHLFGVEVATGFAKKDEIKVDYVLCAKDKKPTILL
ncbi:hypothetical protein [Borreliella valaisiana]